MSFYDDQVTEQGRVVQNVFLADHELGKRRTNQTPFYPGDGSKENYSSIRGDLCLAWNVDSNRGEVYVFSTLNNFGNKTDNLMQLYSELHFAGFSLTEATYKDDKDGGKMGKSMAVHVGGSKTVVNTGTKRIRMGDWVVWYLPDCLSDLQPFPFNSTRYVIPVAPYDPEIHRLTKKALAEYLKKPPAPASPNAAQTQLLLFNLKMIQLSGVAALLRIGAIVPSVNFILPSRPGNDTVATALALPVVPNADEFVEYLARQLGLVDSDKSAKKLYRHINTSRQTVVENVGETFINHAINLDDHNRLFDNLTIGVNLKQQGTKGLLVLDQNANFDNLVRTITIYTENLKQRIIGKALRQANPGDKFDILMGHYSSL